MPTWRQLICRHQALESVLIKRPRDGVTVLAVDLYGHDDAEHELMCHGAHEQAGDLWLTGCQSSLRRLRNGRLFQRRAERNRGIDELPHVAIDEHDVAALAQCQ